MIKHPVLWDISTELPSGKLIGILGPNGSGKTTFLKTVLGLLKPMTGHIDLQASQQPKKHDIAYIPQRKSIDWNFPITVFDLVLMGRYGHLGLFKWPRKADRGSSKKSARNGGYARIQ